MGVPPDQFIQAAMWHGDLARAEAILTAQPQLANANIHTAAVVGDDDAVRRFLRDDPSSATTTGGPWGSQPLVYLGLSRYLRLDTTRSEAFVRAATALLDAGADPNAGFWSNGEFETALYGAAGVAHHPDLTKLLLERGADPNDEEVVYHTPETYDNRALKLVVETGRVTPENLTLMLIRKHDWHDYDGVRWLLEHGASPSHHRARGWHPLHHAIARDNQLGIIDLLFDHGADPTSIVNGVSAIALAARYGRRDVLESIRKRGFALDLDGADARLAACALDELAIDDSPVSDPGAALARFAGNGNVAGLKRLLELGADVNALFAEGDGYWDVAPHSTALHVAAWRAQHEAVRFLLERGATLDRTDGKGRTPLALAVKACVDSYWSDRRAPDSVKALLDAGASVLQGVPLPTGYDEIDLLLGRAHA